MTRIQQNMEYTREISAQIANENWVAFGVGESRFDPWNLVHTDSGKYLYETHLYFNGRRIEIQMGCRKIHRQCYLQFAMFRGSSFVKHPLYDPILLKQFKRAFPNTAIKVNFKLCPKYHNSKITAELCPNPSHFKG